MGKKTTDPVAEQLAALSAEIRASLTKPSQKTWQRIEKSARTLLTREINRGGDKTADKAWFLHKAAATRFEFVRCFSNLKNGRYYEAWCQLERVELALDWLQCNPFYEIAAFEIESFQILVAEWQRIFPYSLFFSPEFIVGRSECSICGTQVDPWSSCGHEKKRVYSGRECLRVVKDCEFVAAALVRDPVQKYSVGFIKDADGNKLDQHDYSIVKFIAERIASPFDKWRTIWIAAHHPHEMFSHVTSNDACPCESGRRYGDCCLRGPGVSRPHLQIFFSKPPPPSLPNAAFAGYGARNGPARLNVQK